jgi:hypothetical protein
MYAGVEDPQQILADPVGVGITAMTPAEITSTCFSRTLSTITPFPAAGLVSCAVVTLSRGLHTRDKPPEPPVDGASRGAGDIGTAVAADHVPCKTIGTRADTGKAHHRKR